MVDFNRIKLKKNLFLYLKVFYFKSSQLNETPNNSELKKTEIIKFRKI